MSDKGSSIPLVDTPWNNPSFNLKEHVFDLKFTPLILYDKRNIFKNKY